MNEMLFTSSLIPPPSSLSDVVVYDLCDGREGDFDDLAVGALNLDAGRCQRLCGLHAADDAAYAVAVRCDDFDVVFAVKRA